MSKPIRHIVFFSLHKGIDESERHEALKLLRKLGEDSEGVLEWRVEFTLDNRKGEILIENSLFRDQEAYEVFKLSDQHRCAGEFMRDISDWLIGDYQE